MISEQKYPLTLLRELVPGESLPGARVRVLTFQCDDTCTPLSPKMMIPSSGLKWYDGTIIRFEKESNQIQIKIGVNVHSVFLDECIFQYVHTLTRQLTTVMSESREDSPIRCIGKRVLLHTSNNRSFYGQIVDASPIQSGDAILADYVVVFDHGDKVHLKRVGEMLLFYEELNLECKNRITTFGREFSFSFTEIPFSHQRLAVWMRHKKSNVQRRIRLESESDDEAVETLMKISDAPSSSLDSKEDTKKDSIIAKLKRENFILREKLDDAKDIVQNMEHNYKVEIEKLQKVSKPQPLDNGNEGLASRLQREEETNKTLMTNLNGAMNALLAGYQAMRDNSIEIQKNALAHCTLVRQMALEQTRKRPRYTLDDESFNTNTELERAKIAYDAEIGQLKIELENIKAQNKQYEELLLGRKSK
jgi:hypothetical protein